MHDGVDWLQQMLPGLECNTSSSSISFNGGDDAVLAEKHLTAP